MLCLPGGQSGNRINESLLVREGLANFCSLSSHMHMNQSTAPMFQVEIWSCKEVRSAFSGTYSGREGGPGLPRDPQLPTPVGPREKEPCTRENPACGSVFLPADPHHTQVEMSNRHLRVESKCLSLVWLSGNRRGVVGNQI